MPRPKLSDEERKARKRARNAAWRKANPEKHAKSAAKATAKWYRANRSEKAEYVAEWYKSNKDQKAGTTANWYKSNKDQVRCNTLRRNYGISLERYNAILEAQGFKCSMCPTPHTDDNKLHVDHCHDTGRVRGLLCMSCNTGIGKLNHDINTLNAAIAYLQKDIDWREVV